MKRKPSMGEHVMRSIRQLREGETIGRRKTPVISFWPMRPKWDKFGSEPWSTVGTDGEAESISGKMVIPAIIQLIYFKCHDGQVCQLAYVLEPEFIGHAATTEANEASKKYLLARESFMPERLAA